MSTMMDKGPQHRHQRPGWSCWACRWWSSPATPAYATYRGSKLAGANASAANLQVLSQQLANQGREAVVAASPRRSRRSRPPRRRSKPTWPSCATATATRPACPGPIEKVAATWAPLGKQRRPGDRRREDGGRIRRQRRQVHRPRPAAAGAAGRSRARDVRRPARRPRRSTSPCARWCWPRPWPSRVTADPRRRRDRERSPATRSSATPTCSSNVLKGLRDGGSANVQKLDQPGRGRRAEPGQRRCGRR